MHSIVLFGTLALLGALEEPAALQSRPNIVLVFTDDQGYSDVGCYGAQGIATPHLDRLAEEGVRFTDFHVAQAVCSASRAALLTGCYSERVSIQGALNPRARKGLHPDEETIADLLREAGYATGAFGKWHLGHKRPFLPLQQGFDEYYGLPYSNDMWPVDYDGVPVTQRSHKAQFQALQLIDGNEPAEEVRTLADQALLTERYTRRALEFVERHKEEPFFLYLAHSMPHVPLGEPLRFAGRNATPYGDVIAEIDDSLGRILAALDEHGLRESTLVIFTSDNGPWLSYGDHGGSAEPLREGKGTSWEGGTRVPCIVRWPGRVPAGRVCDGLTATIDWLPTIAQLAGARSPERPIDGVDISSLLAEPAGASPRTELLYYYGGNLNAVRQGAWKLVFPHTYNSNGPGFEPGRGGHPGKYARHSCELGLFDLAADIGETTDVADEHPDIVGALEGLAERARAELGDRRTKVVGSGVRPPGRLTPRRASPVRHLALGKGVQLDREPDPKYPGGGAVALVDGVLGSEDFTDGTWLGYQGGDVEVLVDLEAPVAVKRIGTSFLQSQGSWVFLPRAIELCASTDGKEFEVLKRFELSPDPDLAEVAKEFTVDFESRMARYVRVRATGGPCPEWHSGAGRGSWVFVDEIVIE